MSNLGKIQTALLSPSDAFILDNHPLDFRIVDFWAWNQSDLVENRNRGILAEFLVMKALGLHRPTRLEWDEVDLITDDNIKIEVKSAAYIQSWKQTDYSSIIFDISPRSKLLPDNNYATEKFRPADVYIFCLLHHKDQATINPMILDQWTFYVVPTKVLEEKLKEQKTLSLSTLLHLDVQGVSFERLRFQFLKTVGREHR
jgi:hypothetical protein